MIEYEEWPEEAKCDKCGCDEPIRGLFPVEGDYWLCNKCLWDRQLQGRLVEYE